MAHTHDVFDMENHFEINGSSRFIKETSETKLVVVQGDHKSEVLTFKMPRYIDGHDMTLCNKIRIHYINLDTKTNNKSADVYEVTDLTLCEECEDVLTFTWVIEAPATKYSGTLSFLVKFECTEGENVLYQWNTAKYVSVNVLAGIDNSEEFVEKYSNVLEEWYNELTKGADSIEELNQQAIAEIELAKEDAKEDIQGKADATMAEMNQFSSNAYNSFKNDVDEKAARTLASIPEDYSDIDEGLKELESKNVRYPTFEKVTFDLVQGYKLSNIGEKLNSGVSTDCITSDIPASEGDLFLITTKAEPWFAYASFFDSNGVKLSMLRNGRNVVNKEEFIAPENTAYLVINAPKGECSALKKVDDVIITETELKLTNSIADTMSFNFREYISEDIPLEMREKLYINLVEKAIKTIGGEYWVSNEIEVSPFDVFEIQSTADWANGFYVFLDTKGDFVSSTKSGYEDNSYNGDIKIFHDIIIAPYNATHLVVSKCGKSQEVFLKKIIKRQTGKCWNGIKWLVLGDSLTEENWTASNKYHKQLNIQMGIVNTNAGQSGAGYARVNSLGNNFISLFKKFENNDYDVITIFGSGNDTDTRFERIEIGNITDTSEDGTICGWINATLDYIYSKMPYTPIGIITPTPWYQYPTNVEGNKMEQYSNALISIAKLRGIPCLDLYHESNLHPEESLSATKFYAESPAIHPNDEGHKRIMPIIREFMKKLIY